jgi:hypothetical protein
MLVPFLALLACSGDSSKDSGPPAPYGIPLAADGMLYAGISRVELTPEGFETFTDLNGDALFDGCTNDPGATRTGCEEPFDDANGNGFFDAAYIAGFGSPRPAQGVHDPLSVTALVLSLDGSYVALVGVDAIGVLENRVRDARDLLAADGFDRDRVVVSASHTHQGVDTVGIWGDAARYVSGVYEPFVEELPGAVRDAIQAAAEGMEPVEARQGITRMRDLDPSLSGEPFGGTNPDASIEGGMDDIRDPILAADDVLAVAFARADGTRVATLVSASGHPEVAGSRNNLLSADYVGVTRETIERRAGGMAVFLSGALGGMQSAAGTPLPDVDDDGNLRLDGAGAPSFSEEESFENSRRWGVLVARAAETALTDATPWDGLRVQHADFLVPVDNVSFKLAFQLRLLDTPDSYVVQDGTCPGWGDPDLFGCVPTGAWRVELGPTTLATVPGELFPELFGGVPDEEAMRDASLRADDRRWVQADPDCAQVDFGTQCRDRETLSVTDCDGEATACNGVCECLRHHATPYVVSNDGDAPIAELLPGRFKAPIGIANGYCGYVVPDPDFSTYASVLTNDGDHYEETNSCSRAFAPLVLDAFARMAAGDAR